MSGIQTWTREAIIAAAREWEAANGRPPSINDWRRASPRHPDSRIVRNRFGTWNAMMLAAGYRPRTSGGQRRWTREQVVHAILVWRFEHGRLPRWDDWRVPASDRPRSWHVRRLFGTWNAAIVAAGYDPVCPRRTRKGYAAVAREAGRRAAA